MQVETLVKNHACFFFWGKRKFELALRQQVVHVDAPVQLAAWNILTNARVLDLLPPLEKCIAKAEGYIEPVEV